MNNLLVGCYSAASVWLLTSPHNYDEPGTFVKALGCILVGVVASKFYTLLEAKK